MNDTNRFARPCNGGFDTIEGVFLACNSLQIGNLYRESATVENGPVSENDIDHGIFVDSKRKLLMAG